MLTMNIKNISLLNPICNKHITTNNFKSIIPNVWNDAFIVIFHYINSALIHFFKQYEPLEKIIFILKRFHIKKETGFIYYIINLI